LATIEETYHQSTGKTNDLETRLTDELQRVSGCVTNLTELLNKRTSAEVWETHKKGIMEEVCGGIEPLKQKQEALTQQCLTLEHKLTIKLNELRNELTS